MGKRRGAETALTELEAAALGVVRLEGPCTAYAIRQHFLDSPAPRWSGSAGAIYPLIRRLESRGLVRSRQADRGRRAQRDFRITRLGGAALKRWLLSPIAESGATLIHDPLRTRLLFLSRLPRRQALTFVSDALDSLRKTLQQTRQECRDGPPSRDEFAYFAARNALLVTKARVDWLIEVRARLQSSVRGGGDLRGNTSRAPSTSETRGRY